jgi:hypothetical protein
MMQESIWDYYSYNSRTNRRYWNRRGTHGRFIKREEQLYRSAVSISRFPLHHEYKDYMITMIGTEEECNLNNLKDLMRKHIGKEVGYPNGDPLNEWFYSCNDGLSNNSDAWNEEEPRPHRLTSDEKIGKIFTDGHWDK